MAGIAWHGMHRLEVLKRLRSSASGLTEKEAAGRLKKHGPNELEKSKAVSPLFVFLNQFRNPLVWLLAIAAAFSFTIGHMLDAVMIFAIVLVNAVLGFTQDWKAERAIEALKAMFVRRATVIRGGKEATIDARFLVPGDVVVLDAGDEVPADARILDSADLQVNEAPLTGESFPAGKFSEAVPEDTPLPERNDMAYAGTLVINGWAEAVVVSTGMRTELGRIAALTQGVERRKTHTEEMLEALGRKLLALFVILCAAASAIGIALGKDAAEMLMTGVSLAVAAIPEGLPAVVTIVFAIGLRRLGSVNALVRRLPATETLGAMTYICTDKTGTLTKNEMTVKEILIDNERISVSGTGYSTEGRFSKKTKSLVRLLETGALCNHASLSGSGVVGDPTEAAILVAAVKGGISKQKLDKEHHIIGEVSFDMTRKMMSVISRNKAGVIVSTKGAPEMVIEKCSRVLLDGRPSRMTEKRRGALSDANSEFAAMGYRMMGFAYKEMKGGEGPEKDLTFIGSMALIDPVRPEAVSAICEARKAGIGVTIVTGDHKSTAMAIADQVGLVGEGAAAVDGRELDRMSDDDLKRRIDGIKVFARVTPEQKMRVLRVLQERGEVVGMTGDGVNDAPALKMADIGIAMGRSGTDVARETAEVVLADDNFASIVNGVSEGRAIFLNIRKFVYYLVSSNIAEVMIIFIGMLLGWPLVLVPVQILWVNLVTDSITALSLGVEPKPSDVMEAKPRNPREPILSSRASVALLSLSGLKTAIILYIFSLYAGISVDTARTMAFAGLVLAENFNLLNFKSLNKPMHRINPLDNAYLIAAILLATVLTIAVVQIPQLNPLFHTVPLNTDDWLLLAGLASLVLLSGEIFKNVSYYLLRRR